MGFLNKLYESVRVNSTVVDHVNSNEIYNTTSQTIGSGTESVDAGTVTAEGVDYKGITPDYRLGAVTPTQDLSSDVSVTATAFTDIQRIRGMQSIADIPQNATLYGNFHAILKAPSNETIHARLQIADDGAAADATEFDISTTVSSALNLVSSGWVEATSITGATAYEGAFGVQSKVTAGTGEYGRWGAAFELAAVES